VQHHRSTDVVAANQGVIRDLAHAVDLWRLS
jgi:hypothetical protein